MDLIDRQEAIKAMSCLTDSICEGEAIEALCDLPAVQLKPKWTRYKKKMPPEGMYVLVSRGYVFWLDCIMGDRGTPYWRQAGDVEIDWDVWMPLPAPYKEDTND